MQRQPEISKETENQAAELIKKRLRFLKKKMTKIEKYEGEPRETLNADQIEAISRKSEVQSTLKELEDVLQNVRAVEVEHESKLATLRKEILAEEASKEKDSMKHVHRINYALGTPLAELIGKHVIKETEYEALKIAQELIMKPNIAKSEADYARDAHNFHQKLWQKSNEKVPRTKLSFKELNGLIIKLLAPPPSVPIFGLFDAPKSQSDGVHQQVQQKNGISFLTSSSQGGKAEKEANIKTNGPRADSESPNKGDVPHQGDRKKKSSKSDSTSPTKKLQEKPSQTVENPQKKTQPRKNADEKTKNGKEKIESIVAKIEPVVVKKEKMTLQLKDATIKLL